MRGGAILPAAGGDVIFLADLDNFGGVPEKFCYRSRALALSVIFSKMSRVLGDNRNNSRDSRWEDVGNIKKSELTGKVFIRIYPFREWGRVR